MSNRGLAFLLAASVAATFPAGGALAGGMYVPTFGTATTGTSTAGANAIAIDASTAIQNPAGMTRLDDHGLVGSLAPGFTTVKFDADEAHRGGGNGGQQGGFIPISSNQYVHKLSDRWRLGLSLVSISGVALDPNNSWAGRNELTEVSLFSLSVAPTVAVRVCDWLSLGGGIAVTYGKLKLKLRLPLDVLGEPTLKLKDMDDVAVAPIASFLIEPNDKFRFGVLYQGETDFKLEGKGKLMGKKADLSLELPLAQAVRAAVFYQPMERLALLGSVGWEDWSAAKNLPLSAPGGSAKVPLGFRDTWYIAVGVRVKLNETWGVQTGFRYDSSALKDGARTTAFPVDRLLMTSAGAVYQHSENLRVSFSFTWVDLGDAKVSTSNVKGQYRRNDLFAFAVSFAWMKLPWSGWATL